MNEHFNVQIHIQRVGTRTQGNPETVKLLDLSVVAESEQQAYDKVSRLLDANRPEPEVHVHRASCDDSRGNHLCGHA